MTIYTMTATFGKLENQTLALQPGLNVISAPNEWGKSTWCTFLATMLYGLDTREKTTKTSLALKERYAPWSGAPMSGRIDMNWNGRDITIERWTKGRTPLGEFRAYETESGLEVPELTGANCGEQLLGVEKSVFLRAGFLRLSDLPVTADESLRRRLNALVTTGDESGAADVLAQKLKDLKNKCRYNRSGLLPQAEEQRRELENKLTELQSLQGLSEKLIARQKEISAQNRALHDHLQALEYAAAQEKFHRVEQAHIAAEAAAQRMAELEEVCGKLISREAAVEQLHRHAQLQQAQAALLQELSALPPEPAQPQTPPRYQGLTPAEAVAQAEEDTRQYAALEAGKKKNSRYWLLYGSICAVLLVIALLANTAWLWIGAGLAAILGGLGVLGFSRMQAGRIQQQKAAILARYPGISPQQWTEDAEFYAETQRQYAEALENALSLRRGLRARIEDNEQAITTLIGGRSSQAFLLHCNEIIASHDAFVDARREHQHAAAHADALRAMTKPVKKPEQPDALTISEAETQQQLSDLDFEQKQLQLRLGQYQGRMDALGSEEALQQQLDAVNQRISKLNLTYNALELALRTLENAAGELQRRFAPRIAESARDIFGKLTGGRYDRLHLTQELSVNTAATEDTTLRAAQWRSEGTIDQLYLSLRLAVARELTPQAPLILDDALVRFDDQRHTAAMEILRQEAQNKQVILFTCQSRETLA